MNNFRDIREDSSNKFSKCDLAKMLDKCVKYVETNIENSYNCPMEHGKWSGERGNSKWYPEKDYIPQKANPEGLTWNQIMNKYRIDGINYRDGEPNFECISKGTVRIEGFTSYRPSNFNKADIELSNRRGCSPDEVRAWRNKNGYTWHECRDMSTMQKVPGIVHNNMTHSGGVSEARKRGI